VNEHRGVEITLGEHLRDVPEMAAYLIAARGVPHVVRADVDRPAVVVQFEMMSGFVMREAHHMIPVLVHHGLVILRENKRCGKEEETGCSYHRHDYLLFFN
jgi:hypothetical protein